MGAPNPSISKAANTAVAFQALCIPSIPSLVLRIKVLFIKSKENNISGFDLVFSSTIPMGAGLSSSAALECGFGYAMNKMFELGLSKEEIAKITQPKKAISYVAKGVLVL